MNQAKISVAEADFGHPADILVRQEILPWELDLIESVCGDTRFHDVTVFTLGPQNMALIRKPSDPPGVYWAPTGGMEQGEELADTVRRETWEETGLVVEPERYFLRMHAVFTSGGRSRPWTSHVFLARCLEGEPGPIDTNEVEAAAWVTTEDFRTRVAPLLLASGWGRFCYRLCISELLFADLGWGSLGLPLACVRQE